MSQADPNCIFCKIVAGEIPSRKVFENDELLAFHDINPWAPVHVLVIPKAHFGSLNDVQDAQVVGAVALLAQQVARELGVAESGYRTVMNTGKDGGQTVGHLHMHLLAGRAMHWPPG